LEIKAVGAFLKESDEEITRMSTKKKRERKIDGRKERKCLDEE
jgi:hypothetical protein